MFITREQMIKKLSEESGYYQKDIRNVLHAMDDVVLDCFDKVTDDEEVSVQLVEGIKCGCKIIPTRDRVDPRDGSPIVCPPTCRPFVKFSEGFKENIQKQYELKKDG